MNNSKKFVIGLAIFALLGAIFAGVSTYDFIAHLDRQVHAITCAFVPGLSAKDATGSSGCYAALMSTYSSVFRQSVWGGIPIALPGLAVFAYLLFLALDLLLNRESADLGKARYAIAATGLPCLISLVYLFISIKYVGSICKLCVGIYLASFGAFLCAILLARAVDAAATQGKSHAPGMLRYLIYFVEGVIFVFLPVSLYVGLAPAYAAEPGKCGELLRPEDKYNIMAPLSSSVGGIDAIEVFDPLCPACKGFAERMESSGLSEKLRLRAVMFPLDTECNWMVKTSLHPGACAVSEAVLCAGDDAETVVSWVFANQKELRELAERSGSAAVQRRMREQFASLANCIGKPEVKAKINRSLRWIVANSLSVLTPQLFIQNRKLCDEDTDLGLEYSLSRLLESVPSSSTTGRDNR
jgi:uncharacterized membrane protein